MRVTRRKLLSSGLFSGILGALGFVSVRYGGKVEALETDPNTERFFYRDGWIEAVR